MNKFTYKAIVKGKYNRIVRDKFVVAKLYETEGYWISQFGFKFKKVDGKGVGSKSMFDLDLSTLEELS